MIHTHLDFEGLQGRDFSMQHIRRPVSTLKKIRKIYPSNKPSQTISGGPQSKPIPLKNVEAAYTYLKGLIWMPDGYTDAGAPDPGWCCSEHAVILARALRHHGGFAPEIAKGSVHWAGPSRGNVYLHYFVIDGSGLVYDSSIQDTGIAGVYKSNGLFSNSNTCHLAQPGMKANQNTSSLNRVNLQLFYTCDSFYQLKKSALFESATPYCNWLTLQSVAHEEFFAKAAMLTARLLDGSLALPQHITPSYLGIQQPTRRAEMKNWTYSFP